MQFSKSANYAALRLKATISKRNVDLIVSFLLSAGVSIRTTQSNWSNPYSEANVQTSMCTIQAIDSRQRRSKNNVNLVCYDPC